VADDQPPQPAQDLADGDSDPDQLGFEFALFDSDSADMPGIELPSGLDFLDDEQELGFTANAVTDEAPEDFLLAAQALEVPDDDRAVEPDEAQGSQSWLTPDDIVPEDFLLSAVSADVPDGEYHEELGSESPPVPSNDPTPPPEHGLALAGFDYVNDHLEHVELGFAGKPDDGQYFPMPPTVASPNDEIIELAAQEPVELGFNSLPEATDPWCPRPGGPTSWADCMSEPLVVWLPRSTGSGTWTARQVGAAGSWIDRPTSDPNSPWVIR